MAHTLHPKAYTTGLSSSYGLADPETKLTCDYGLGKGLRDRTLGEGLGFGVHLGGSMTPLVLREKPKLHAAVAPADDAIAATFAVAILTFAVDAVAAVSAVVAVVAADVAAAGVALLVQRLCGFRYWR